MGCFCALTENVLGYFQGYYGLRGLQFYFRTLAKLLATVSICAKLVTTTHLFTILSREITLTSYTVSIYGQSLPPPSVVQPLPLVSISMSAERLPFIEVLSILSLIPAPVASVGGEYRSKDAPHSPPSSMITVVSHF